MTTKDEAGGRSLPNELPEADDDIEIIEVVGVDEDAPPPGDADDEVILSFDEAEGSAVTSATDPSAPADLDSKREETAERERLIRLQADFENLKKRIERERDDYHRYATASLVTRLLQVLDNFERALACDPESEEQNAFRDGIALIHRQLIEELTKEGLRPVEAVGQPFDPSRHEAVATDAASDQPPNTVLEEFQRGYLFQDRLLRPALVRVSVDGSGQADSGNGGEES